MALPQSLQDPLALPRAGAPLLIVSTPDLDPAHGETGITGSLPGVSARLRKVLEWLALAAPRGARKEAT